VEKLWRGSPQGASRKGRLRLYELVERRTFGFVFRTTRSGSLTRTGRLACSSLLTEATPNGEAARENVGTRKRGVG